MFLVQSLRHQFPPSVVSDTEPFRGVNLSRLKISGTGITAIIGASGSGKSTLLSLLAGFFKPNQTNGDTRILFNGRSILDKGHRPGSVAFVFQSPMLLDSAGLMVNALQGRSISEKDELLTDTELEQIRQWLKKLGLDQSADSLFCKPAERFSGGEKQRLSILRALMANPEVVLCDEPTSSLDDRNATQALDTLRAWSDDHNRPVVIVTHNLQQASRYADDFIFLQNGEQYHPQLAIPELDSDCVTGTESRLESLRSIVEGMSKLCYTPDKSTYERTRSTDYTNNSAISVPPWRYRQWISHALSTDAAYREWGEKILGSTAFLSKSLQPLVNTFDSKYYSFWKTRLFSGTRQLLAFLTHYTGWPLSGILLVQMLLVTLVTFGALSALEYSNKKLEDPSVARMVFEHSILGTSQTAANIDGDVGVARLTHEITEFISADSPELNDIPQGISIYGRRTLNGSRIWFQSGKTNCQSRPWDNKGDVVVIDDQDPILNQLSLSTVASTNPVKLDKLLLDKSDNIQLFMEASLLARLVKHCNFNSTEKIQVQWTPNVAAGNTTLTAEIVASVNQFPPLYPLNPEMMLLSTDFENASQLANFVPDSYRVLTAYFPINYFDSVKSAIQSKGYVIRDDSEAAVQTLKSVKQAAKTLPGVFLPVSLLGCILVVLLFIDRIIKLNSKTFALFAAHGFRHRDIVMTIALHVMPAFLISFIMFLLLVFPILHTYQSTLEGYIESPRLTLIIASLVSSTGVLLAGLFALLVVVPIRWWSIRRNTATYLKG